MFTNVGIGTTTPNAKALLDLSSTTKGLLIPSMTTSQRLAITSPPNGLMVYDTDKNEFHQYAGTKWSPILNGSYWIRPITSRKRITNASDSFSVGIGTNSPTEWLDVDGNIRARQNINADAIVQGNALLSSGTLTAVGTSLLNGDVTTNSDLIINNTAATVQLKSNLADKGFVQLSGDNLRLGTNSSNTNGRFIVRVAGTDRMTVFENGNVGIGTSSIPTVKLRVAGSAVIQDTLTVQDVINVGDKITSTFTGNNNLIPLCYGSVDRQGYLKRGTGNVSSSLTTTGNGESYFTISCSSITSTSVFMATPNAATDLGLGTYSINIRYLSPGNAKVTVYYVYPNQDPATTNQEFLFVIYK